MFEFSETQFSQDLYPGWNSLSQQVQTPVWPLEAQHEDWLKEKSGEGSFWVATETDICKKYYKEKGDSERGEDSGDVERTDFDEITPIGGKKDSSQEIKSSMIPKEIAENSEEPSCQNIPSTTPDKEAPTTIESGLKDKFSNRTRFNRNHECEMYKVFENLCHEYNLKISEFWEQKPLSEEQNKLLEILSEKIEWNK